jgi:hypothetical protein
MRVSWKKILGCTFVLAVAVAMALPGLQAGPIAGGKFKLPFDAKLGAVTLPTGEYTFAVDHASFNSSVYIYQDGRGRGIVRPQSFNGQLSHNEGAVLVCVRHDGNTAVRALKLPEIGTYYFELPKDMKTLVAEQPQLLETITVEATGY